MIIFKMSSIMYIHWKERGMENETGIEMFKGNNGILFLKSALNGLIFLLLLAFCLFDIYGLRIYVIGSVVFLVILLLFISGNGFRFDDDKKEIVKPFPMNIPYKEIRAISIHGSGKGVTILAVTGELSRRILVESLPGVMKDRVIRELRERFPDIRIRENTFSLWKMILGGEFAIFCACLLATVVMLNAYPYLRSVPEDMVVEKPALIDYRMEQYTAGALTFRVPRTFKLFSELSNGYMFQHTDKIVNMRVVSGMYDMTLGRKKGFIEKITGLKGIYDFYLMGYCARFGIVPLVFKKMMVGETQDPKISLIRHIDYRGFVLQGKREGRYFAHILIAMRSSDKDVHFFLYSDKPDNDKLIRLLLENIRPKEK